MAPDAERILERFLSSYDGKLGDFTRQEDSSNVSSSATCPDGDSVSTVYFEVCENVEEMYQNRKSYILSKRKRLGPMGKLEEFQCPSGFDESYGGILNFKLLGKVGGFFYYVGRRGDVLAFMQVYSTASGSQISDADRDSIIECACGSIGDELRSNIRVTGFRSRGRSRPHSR